MAHQRASRKKGPENKTNKRPAQERKDNTKRRRKTQNKENQASLKLVQMKPQINKTEPKNKTRKTKNNKRANTKETGPKNPGTRTNLDRKKDVIHKTNNKITTNKKQQKIPYALKTYSKKMKHTFVCGQNKSTKEEKHKQGCLKEKFHKETQANKMR